MAILEVKDLFFSFPDGDHRKVILDHIDIAFETGTFYTILGASGSGKTTFLSLLAALDKPEEGYVFYQRQSIEALGYENYRRNKIGIVFQAYNLIPYMSALENVMVATSITDNPMPQNQKEHALELLAKVEIDETKAKRKVTHLSGGEQQRVAIARAIATNVGIILADEPTGNLDHESSQKIVEIFKKLAHEENKCVIVVTHSKDVADESDVVLKLDTRIQKFTIETN